MGSVERLPSGRYQARWRDDKGKQRKATFDRQGDATRHWKAQEVARDRGEYVAPTRITVGEYAAQWAKTRPHRPTTAARTEAEIRLHIAGHAIGRMRLKDVRHSDVQGWVSEKAQTLAPLTVRNLLTTLKSIYATAALDGLLLRSPAAGVKLPRHERPRIVPLTVAQVNALAEAMPARYRAAVIAQAGLGLRIGELLGLRVEDVDFLHRVVQVRGQRPSGARVRTDVTKTPRSLRDVPLPNVVADALAQHLAAYSPGEDGSIFTGQNGKGLGGDWYGTRVFKKAVEAAGLPNGTTSHALRHAYASWLLEAGESVVAVAERLGDTPGMIFKVYGHVMPGTQDRTRRAIDDAWNRAPDVPLEAHHRL